jgi:hypothetical protein
VISLYKHPNARKGRYCAICLDRTRGPAQRVQLAFGVDVHLCAGHASVEFRTRRRGRDFALTLRHAWSASGCLTKRRAQALDAHLAAVRGPNPPAERPRPGSYAWPMLRDEAERRSAAGESEATIVASLRKRSAPNVSRAPSVRTIRRWLGEQRWLAKLTRQPQPPTGLRGREPLVQAPQAAPLVANAPPAARSGRRHRPLPGGT